jgi:hypothetical protein
MRFRGLVTILTIAGSGFVSSLRADDLPARKPGLWEITETSVSSDHPIPTARVCIDEATEPLLNNINLITSRPRCSDRHQSSSSDGLTIDSVCEFRNSRVTTRAKIEIPHSDSYHIEAHSFFDPSLFGQREATRIQDGKWTGPCPPDMKPSDFIAEGIPKRNLAGNDQSSGTEGFKSLQ